MKYWEIDNEVDPKTTSAAEYVEIVNKLVPRMKAIDPNIKIIACGSFTGDKMKWDTDVVMGAGKNFDYLSIHRYDDPNGFAFNPWDNQKFYVSFVIDDGGKKYQSGDRYSLYFPTPRNKRKEWGIKGQYIGFNFNDDTIYRYDCGCANTTNFYMGKKVKIEDLPKHVQEWVMAEQENYNNVIRNK